MRKLYIFDIDGSLADDSSKAILGKDFYSESNFRQLPAHAGILTKAKQVSPNDLVILTARYDKSRSVTEEWLKDKLGYNPVLVMLPTKMGGSAAPMFKLNEMLRIIKLWGNPDKIYFFEDDPEILTCIKHAMIHSHRKELANLVINKCFKGKFTTLVL